MKYMRRKGQIFLIMTILVVAFIIGISSVLLDIRQSDFIDPAPDASEAISAWEITTESLTQIMEIALAQDSNGVFTDISQPLQDLRIYLSGRGITNSIELNGGTNINTVTGPSSLLTQTASALFDVYLASGTTVIEQSVEISISYTADATVNNVITLFKVINGETIFITEASFTITVTNNGNGSFSHSSPGSVDVVTSTNVFFESLTAT